MDAADTTWIEEEDSGETTARLTFLWGNPDGEQVVGTMLQLPAGFDGLLSLQLDESEKAKALPTGSYFGSNAPSTHRFHCDAECILYVRTKGKFTLKP